MYFYLILIYIGIMDSKCGIITYSPGGEFHRANQVFFQLVAIHSGNVVLETNNQAESIGEGSVFFLIPGNKYDFYFSTYCETCHSWIEFHGLSEGFKRKIPQRILPLSDRMACLIELHLQYRNAESLEKDVLADIARASLKQYISDLSQIDTGGYEQNQIIEKTFTFLRQNAHLPLNLEALAGHIGVSKEHLCRIFKKAGRKSPMSLYWQYKTEMARDLIVHTNRTFGDIADELAFSSPYHFSRKVKEVTGRSPKEWRMGI